MSMADSVCHASPNFSVRLQTEILLTETSDFLKQIVFLKLIQCFEVNGCTGKGARSNKIFFFSLIGSLRISKKKDYALCALYVESKLKIVSR